MQKFIKGDLIYYKNTNIRYKILDIKESGLMYVVLYYNPNHNNPVWKESFLFEPIYKEEDLTPRSTSGLGNEYYELPSGAEEIQDLIEEKEMNFSIGNIFKACYRLGSKEGVDRLYDLEKIKWFVEREIEVERKKSV